MTPPPPETRSQDRLGELEHRLESLNTTMHARFEQSSLDIAELKLTTTRLEEFMQKRLDELMQQLESRFPSPPKVHSAIGTQPLGSTGNGDGGSSSTVHSRLPTFGTFPEPFPPPQQPPQHPPHASSYVIPTKQSRVEFPRFNGTDFRGWAYRYRQFFEVDGTPPDHRIRLLSIHLEGHALRWHQTFMRHRAFTDLRWEDYFVQMEAKFTDIRDEHPLIALKKLQQGDGLVVDYEKQFDELLSEIDIPESIAVNLFIGGLHSDIRQFVLNFSPPSLASATSSARLQEATIRTLHEHAPKRDRRFPSNGQSLDSDLKSSAVMGSKTGLSPFLHSDPPKLPVQLSKTGTTSFSSGSLLTPSSTPSSGSISKPTCQLTKREMDDRCRQGPCYWCPAKYSSGHQCPASQAYMLVVDGDDYYFEDALGATVGSKTPDSPST